MFSYSTEMTKGEDGLGHESITDIAILDRPNMDPFLYSEDPERNSHLTTYHPLFENAPY